MLNWKDEDDGNKIRKRNGQRRKEVKEKGNSIVKSSSQELWYSVMHATWQPVNKMSLASVMGGKRKKKFNTENVSEGITFMYLYSPYYIWILFGVFSIQKLACAS